MRASAKTVSVEIAPSRFGPASVRKAVFRVFRDEVGHWRVSSDDGMCGGTFFDRESAIRFARRESASFPVLERPRTLKHSRSLRLRLGS
jgi:hypothetical protein